MIYKVLAPSKRWLLVWDFWSILPVGLRSLQKWVKIEPFGSHEVTNVELSWSSNVLPLKSFRSFPLVRVKNSLKNTSGEVSLLPFLQDGPREPIVKSMERHGGPYKWPYKLVTGAINHIYEVEQPHFWRPYGRKHIRGEIAVRNSFHLFFRRAQKPQNAGTKRWFLGRKLRFFFSEMLVMICLVHDDCRKKDQSWVMWCWFIGLVDSGLFSWSHCILPLTL